MTYKFSGIDHVQLAAPKGSEDQARAFFADLLGWQEVSKPANLAKRGGCWFVCGAHQVHIGVQDDFVSAKKAHPAFHVENLNGLREHLVGKGVNVKEDEPLEGAIRFYLDDPFGNRLEFLEWVK